MYSGSEFIMHSIMVFYLFFRRSGVGSWKEELSSLTEDAETRTVHLPSTISPCMKGKSNIRYALCSHLIIIRTIRGNYMFLVHVK
jgi:hypothetical protein